jgi:hypothetical protein
MGGVYRATKDFQLRIKRWKGQWEYVDEIQYKANQAKKL